MAQAYQVTPYDMEQPTRFFMRTRQAIKHAEAVPGEVFRVRLTRDHLVRLLNEEGGFIEEKTLIWSSPKPLEL